MLKIQNLSSKQRVAVELLAKGAKTATAAEGAGVSRQTISAWINRDDAFKAALESRTAELEANVRGVDSESPERSIPSKLGAMIYSPTSGLTPEQWADASYMATMSVKRNRLADAAESLDKATRETQKAELIAMCHFLKGEAPPHYSDYPPLREAQALLEEHMAGGKTEADCLAHMNALKEKQEYDDARSALVRLEASVMLGEATEADLIDARAKLEETRSRAERHIRALEIHGHARDILAARIAKLSREAVEKLAEEVNGRYLASLVTFRKLLTELVPANIAVRNICIERMQRLPHVEAAHTVPVPKALVDIPDFYLPGLEDLIDRIDAYLESCGVYDDVPELAEAV